MNDILSVEGLEMHFRNCKALRGVDFRVEAGKVFALLGENGAGKTTLIRILTGFQRPTRGTCKVLGLDPIRDSLEIRRRIGYVSDSPAMYDWMTVGEVGWFTASFYPEGFLDRYRELIYRYELPESRKLRHLSKGQRSKVALALALAHEPELLILDEPTSGLDPIVRREFMESMIEVAASGRTVLLSSHQIAEVERVADTIGILHEGSFQLVEDLHVARESTRVVTVSLSDPLVALPDLSPPSRILHEKAEGRQRQYIVRSDMETIEREWRSCAGVASIDSRPASLDELFLAFTRPNYHPQNPNTRREAIAS